MFHNIITDRIPKKTLPITNNKGVKFIQNIRWSDLILFIDLSFKSEWFLK